MRTPTLPDNDYLPGRAEPATERPKVLLLAYSCSPYRGGEPGVGWQRVLWAAQHYDTWVLCKQQRFEADIRKYLEENGEIPGLHFIFIPRTRFEKLLKITGSAGFYLAYNLWHRRAYEAAVRLHQEHHFELAHQVNFNGFREPGYLWKLGIPFIWGPVGGTQNYPWRFLWYAGLKGALKEGSRNVLNSLQLRVNPRVRQATRRARALLTANSQGERDFIRVHHAAPVLLLETGTREVQARPRPARPAGGPVRLLWSGVLEHHKALHLLLLALGKFPSSLPFELRILGRGPLRRRWEKLARRLGIEARCTWMGWLAHAEALAQYSWADAFVFTSLRDTSGNVVLEALGHGVPVICLDHQGAGDMVTATCGIKIPVTSPAETISRLGEAIARVAGDRAALAALSRGALSRARDYLWSRNGERLAEIYARVLAAGEEANQDAR